MVLLHLIVSFVFLLCILDIPRLKSTRISLTYMFCMGVLSDR